MRRASFASTLKLAANAIPTEAKVEAYPDPNFGNDSQDDIYFSPVTNIVAMAGVPALVLLVGLLVVIASRIGGGRFGTGISALLKT
jgi:hypothetical protein